MANFTFDIHACQPLVPVYNVLKTEMEGLRVRTRLKSTDPVKKWEIEIRGRTNSERDSIVSHYNGQNGSVLPFYWDVPSIWQTAAGGSQYYVRYEEFDYGSPDGLTNIWDFFITFIEYI